jgi:AcrR family transcriptional regulator
MAAPRRARSSTEEKRQRLLDATEEIMLKEGYAAVSSRSVAAAVGINASLVHYYFTTLDDLFVAVLQRRAGRNVERMAEALAAPEPLRAWWTLVSDPRGTALFIELLAAANHRPELKAELGAIAHDVRSMQMERLATLVGEYGLDPDEFPPALIAAAVQGLAFSVIADQAAGYETAHDEAIAGMGRFIDRLEARRSQARR